ncbi:uncharacterized protein LOC112327361 isoform X2 [Populus trichocarpa]|uniref:uncharacterized protein LOC112327361 isoform X2 n=1 Tax=Populus trichocarpa TaxID=3694 RepID=UPI000D18ABDA|nr:uncharacterized protein LOC112327361 isoform X2 [Populus trichocarpa]|eukprot:XP_024455944.1 uncharacterized protein LOC112327361 isoform X3 [Populus trichocarpa]
MGVEENLAYGIKFVFERQILGIKAWKMGSRKNINWLMKVLFRHNWLENCSLSTTGQMMEDLRERYFGPLFELFSHDKYPEIWALDDKDPFMQPEGGESVNDVDLMRLQILIC